MPIVDDAGLHQIGDPVADRPRMDAETLLAPERGGHRLRYRAEAELDRRAVRDQPGDMIGDGAVDRPRRPRRQFDRWYGGRHQHIDRRRLDCRIAAGPRQFRVDLRDYQPRPADSLVQMLDAEPGIVPPRCDRPLTCSSTRSIGRRPLDTRPLISEILAGMTLSARLAKNRRPALAPPNAVTITLG